MPRAGDTNPWYDFADAMREAIDRWDIYCVWAKGNIVREKGNKGVENKGGAPKGKGMGFIPRTPDGGTVFAQEGLGRFSESNGKSSSSKRRRCEGKGGFSESNGVVFENGNSESKGTKPPAEGTPVDGKGIGMHGGTGVPEAELSSDSSSADSSI